MKTQWLLLGGPAHGLTVTVLYGSRVRFRGALYDGENYLMEGKLYRIGFCPETTPAQRSEAPRLIHDLKVRPIT